MQLLSYSYKKSFATQKFIYTLLGYNTICFLYIFWTFASVFSCEFYSLLFRPFRFKLHTCYGCFTTSMNYSQREAFFSSVGTTLSWSSINARLNNKCQNFSSLFLRAFHDRHSTRLTSCQTKCKEMRRKTIGSMAIVYVCDH